MRNDARANGGHRGDHAGARARAFLVKVFAVDDGHQVYQMAARATSVANALASVAMDEIVKENDPTPPCGDPPR